MRLGNKIGLGIMASCVFVGLTNSKAHAMFKNRSSVNYVSSKVGGFTEPNNQEMVNMLRGIGDNIHGAGSVSSNGSMSGAKLTGNLLTSSGTKSKLVNDNRILETKFASKPSKVTPGVSKLVPEADRDRVSVEYRGGTPYYTYLLQQKEDNTLNLVGEFRKIGDSVNNKN